MTSKHLSNKKSAHKKPKKAKPKGLMAGLRATRKPKKAKVPSGRS